MHPKFIQNIDNWAIQFKKKRWLISKESLNQIKKNWVKTFIISSFVITLLVILVSFGHGVYKYFKDGDPIYSSERIGAVCNDGWISSATGSGACSNHGGVKYWRYSRVGTHHFKINSYILPIGISSSFIFLLSLISRSSRKIFIAGLSEIVYIVGLITYYVLFISIIILTSPYFIYKHKTRKKISEESERNDFSNAYDSIDDDLPF